MAYSELIKNFSRIRAYLRSFYVFGFQHRGEFTQKSARSYDNERRRIENWLGDYMSFGQDADGRRVFLSVDSRAILENPLYRAFRTKSFTSRDIALHFHILDMLADGDELSLIDIMDELMDRFSAFAEGDLPDESTIRIKMKEYVSLGLIKSSRKGREMTYQISNENPKLDGWNEALAFFSEALPLGVVGSYVQDRLPVRFPFFRFKHHYILNALDSELIYDIFTAIRKKQGIIITTQNEKIEVSPLKVYIGTQTGRQYLLGWVQESEGFFFFRIDRMEQVKEIGLMTEPSQSLSDFQQHVWGVSAGEDRQLEHLAMTVFIDEGEEFIINRLEREKRCGRFVRLDDHHVQIVTDVFDALEMLPWLRTFIGRVTDLTCSNPEVLNRFWGSCEDLYRMYGVEEDVVS